MHISLHLNSTKPPWEFTEFVQDRETGKLEANYVTVAHNQSATISEGHGSQPIDASIITLNSEQKHVLDLVINERRNVFFTGPAGTGKSVLMRAIISGLRKRWVHDPKRLGVTALTGLAACNIGGQAFHNRLRYSKEYPTVRWNSADHDGRLLQLPPVPDGHQKEVRFAFDSAAWASCIDYTVGFTQVFRQRDPEFTDMLNEIRLGTISYNTVQKFENLSRPLNFSDGIGVTT
ncbi:hypothetical protein F4824DRAFT_464571 [Ustulina deusta]|nr:hypothetical protein F4824DRAFT_464571 [Ustulina deusta]